jgi:hypothetical protein
LQKEQKTITLTNEEYSKTYEREIETVTGGYNDKFIAKGLLKDCSNVLKKWD